jgi:hypothetical protein
MIKGKSIVEFAQELTRIHETARDFIVPTEKLRANVIDGEFKLGFEDKNYNINNWSGGQLSGFTDIPKAYFDRIKEENPILLRDAVNHGLKTSAKAKIESGKMVRTLDGNIRGLLSSRYRVLDSHDMLETIFPIIQQNNMNIVASDITEQKMYIKALSPSIQGEIKKGDVVQYGLTISTSDVGAGSVRVEPLIYRLVCDNGLIMPNSIRKYHAGKNQFEVDIRELLSDETKSMSDAAFWMQVRDMVLASLKPENFEMELDKLRIAAGLEIKNFDLPKVVEMTMKAVGVSGEAKKNSILAALASGNEGAGLNQWGLINSFTKAAHAGGFGFEESIDLERAGGRIIELSGSAWSRIAG